MLRRCNLMTNLARFSAAKVLYPELQRRQIMRARKRRLRTSVLKSLASSASPFGSLMLPSGELNDEVSYDAGEWCMPPLQCS